MIDIVLLADAWPRMTVSLYNRSSDELRFWQDANSWGWWQWSFLLVFEDGSVIHVIHKNADFTVNAPKYFTLTSDGVKRTEMNLSDGWWSIPDDVEFSRPPYAASVLLRVTETVESSEFGVWTGISMSPWAFPRRDSSN